MIRKRKFIVTDEDIVSYYQTMEQFVKEYFGKTDEVQDIFDDHLEKVIKNFKRLEKRKQEEKKLQEELEKSGWD